MKLNKDSIEVAEGIYIRRTGAKGIFQCYFRIAGQEKPFRCSTKTSNELTAKTKALQYYQNAQQRTEQELVIDKVSFSTLSKRYLESLSSDPQNYKRQTIKRHFLPFFSRFDDVSTIKNRHIHEYIEFRQKKGSPKPSTINRENSVLSGIIQHGIKHDLITNDLKIKTLSITHTKHRHSHFTPEEYRRLYTTSRKRLYSAKKQDNQRIYWGRLVLHNYILILANTGLRPSEARSVIWRNINLDKQTMILWEAGKRHDTRTVTIDGYGVRALERLYEARLDYLKSFDPTISKVPPEERAISYPDGKPFTDSRKSFNSLLKACNFTYTNKIDKHCFLSLRHTYATVKLTEQDERKRTPTRALAKQMGTSERMINLHYAHDETLDYRDSLIRFDRKKKQ